MKTVVSVPDSIFAATEALARRLGISRSHLYTIALAEYVARLQGSQVTDRLDEVYARQGSTLEPGLRRAQRRSVMRSEW